MRGHSQKFKSMAGIPIVHYRTKYFIIKNAYIFLPLEIFILMDVFVVCDHMCPPVYLECTHKSTMYYSQLYFAQVLTCSVSNFQRMSSNSKFGLLVLNGQYELF